MSSLAKNNGKMLSFSFIGCTDFGYNFEGFLQILKHLFHYLKQYFCTLHRSITKPLWSEHGISVLLLLLLLEGTARND